VTRFHLNPTSIGCKEPIVIGIIGFQKNLLTRLHLCFYQKRFLTEVISFSILKQMAYYFPPNTLAHDLESSTLGTKCLNDIMKSVGLY